MTEFRKKLRGYWLPATVFLIGIASAYLLFWIDRINDEGHRNMLLVDALLDVQRHTDLFHLRLDEYIRGESQEDINYVMKDWENAERLLDAILRGGVNELGLPLGTLSHGQHKAQGEAIHSLLLKLKVLALERIERPGKKADERFHGMFNSMLSKASSLEKKLKEESRVVMEESQLLFRGIILVWACIIVFAAAYVWFLERGRKKAGEDLLKAHEQLISQAEELKGHRERLAELLETRTAELRTANNLLMAENSERRQVEESLRESEKQIRHLSSRLLTAQEIERRRISMELHDELGQALNGIKLQIRAIERAMGSDHPGVRDDCENLLKYMDQVIEDVRRLALDLSPSVLEDLGLRAAIQWLVGGFNRNAAMSVTFDAGDIDHLVPENQWIVVYRIIQEALNNINKHAQAQNVAVTIRPQDDGIAFTVKDDGRGFDPLQAAMKAATDRGLGLTTMSERVRMIGGVLDVWSREGKGTIIKFSIPVEKGEA